MEKCKTCISIGLYAFELNKFGSATSNLIVLFIKYTEITVENHKSATSIYTAFSWSHLKKPFHLNIFGMRLETHGTESIKPNQWFWIRWKLKRTSGGSRHIKQQQPINVGLKVIYQIEIRIPQIDQVETFSTKHA